LDDEEFNLKQLLTALAHELVLALSRFMTAESGCADVCAKDIGAGDVDQIAGFNCWMD